MVNYSQSSRLFYINRRHCWLAALDVFCWQWTYLALISNGLSFIKPVDPALSASQPILSIILNGVWGGFNAGLTLIIPFVIPFYLFFAIVEDSGILTRVAFMMDSAMHKIGLHGKALIPIILGLRL